MRLIMLGTGHAMVTRCYNTCFALEDGDEYFLVDAGGGNGILCQLEKAKIDWRKIKTIFVTHKHIDHLLGVLWLIRRLGQKMLRGEYEEEVTIYGCDGVTDTLDEMVRLLLPQKICSFLGEQIHLVTVKDGEKKQILGHEVTFFDIHSTKEKQFGFTLFYDEAGQKKLTCLGDEPFHICNGKYVKKSTWLMHEAFCLYEEREEFEPYEKSHSTVKEACEMAQEYEIPNLILYHTEDKNIERRKELYTREGELFYQGKLYIPEDLETIRL
ncbi:MAG: MBL fold metallo-hydrolase [Lachnospiraceae bacterium]|nr:MBL fold metallo-hydrolase [Lachnospiraceae bacterium]